MTHQRHWHCTAAMVLMSFSAPIKVLVKTDTMPSPELGGGHEAARVHHALRRCGGGMAGGGAWATAGEGADYRIFRCGHAFSMEPMGRRFCAATARPWLDRGS